MPQITAWTNAQPVSIASSIAIFQCCNCTFNNNRAEIAYDPRYALVFVCRICSHFVCPEHNYGGLCPGCWYER